MRKVILAAAVVGLTVAMTPTVGQAAVNYFDTTKVVTGTGSVTCPSGWKVTGGGSGPLPKNSYNSNYSTEYEFRGAYVSGNGYRTDASKISGSYSSNKGWTFREYSYGMKVQAICTR